MLSTLYHASISPNATNGVKDSIILIYGIVMEYNFKIEKRFSDR